MPPSATPAEAENGAASPSLTIPPSTEAREAAVRQRAEPTTDVDAVREALHRTLAKVRHDVTSRVQSAGRRRRNSRSRSMDNDRRSGRPAICRQG